jgi:hypothetical protein
MIKMKKLIRFLIRESDGVFCAKLFTRKRNLFFMNNVYNKVAVASVCTALAFAIGESKEVKAATFSLPSTITAEIIDHELTDSSGVVVVNYDGLADEIFYEISNITVGRGPSGEGTQLTEFNIGSLFFAPNTAISSAVLQVEIEALAMTGFGLRGVPARTLSIFGYVGNGTIEASDFKAGVLLNTVDVSSSSVGDILNFNVTPFINQQVRNGDTFAGFGIRSLDFGSLSLNNNEAGIKPTLIVETADVAEPVPEPTTIFGSTIALSIGGWLKRKKSILQNKAKSQA